MGSLRMLRWHHIGHDHTVVLFLGDLDGSLAHVPWRCTLNRRLLLLWADLFLFNCWLILLGRCMGYSIR